MVKAYFSKDGMGVVVNVRIATINSPYSHRTIRRCPISTGREDASVSGSVVVPIARRGAGSSGNSRNSRFGGINSRFGCPKFPFSYATGI
jgi:hypothetical protein